MFKLLCAGYTFSPSVGEVGPIGHQVDHEGQFVGAEVSSFIRYLRDEGPAEDELEILSVSDAEPTGPEEVETVGRYGRHVGQLVHVHVAGAMLVEGSGGGVGRRGECFVSDLRRKNREP